MKMNSPQAMHKARMKLVGCWQPKQMSNMSRKRSKSYLITQTVKKMKVAARTRPEIDPLVSKWVILMDCRQLKHTWSRSASSWQARPCPPNCSSPRANKCSCKTNLPRSIEVAMQQIGIRTRTTYIRQWTLHKP